MNETNLTILLELKHPIIQAPMAGVTTPEFVATSAEAGILGSIGAGYLSANETRQFIRDVKERTKKSFAVNLFVPERVEVDPLYLRQAYEALQPIGKQLGLPFWEVTLSESEFDRQVEVVVEEGVKICSFTFGLPDEKTVRLLKGNDVYLIGTATTVEEAKLVEQAGMDAIVVQGSEAGGHRGSFAGEITMIPLVELLGAVVATVQIPVIAAGGIANKEMMGKALSAGAQAVQIGTAFLAADESGAHPLYKQATLDAEVGCTVLTKAFSGKTARGIRNRFIIEMREEVIAPYPYQNDLTKKIRKEAAKQGNTDFMSLWAGESVHLSTSEKLKAIIGKLI
ncbi:nitronate monooxygenase [Sporosarcina sp. E16_3]|uniref:NAD(P)H-dependent flavin oxidoreductase n=1 Tax=Sporosarcina sp. E16_3 TaxID=2789293 RepID=UPI001A91D21A|nr:nitronate monooxygenase [Sporosarcina sp. E16_3]MBO0600797.1 nitronate monooxygenase [Sporosarcina sp. E16_3]